MGGLTSRNKGKRGEREVVDLLQPIVDEALGEGVVILCRNLNQSDTGGYDMEGLPWLALEVKRQETEQLPAWWRQTLAQCGVGQLPVLLYRANRKPWRVKTVMYLDGVEPVEVTMELDQFSRYFRACLHTAQR